MPAPDATRPLRITYVIGSLEVGGTETQLVQLASRLPRERFDVEVWCLGRAGALGDSLAAGGVRVRELDLRSRRVAHAPRNLARMVRLWRAMRGRRPDVVHGLLYWAYVTGALTGRAAGVPVVVASRRSLGRFKEGHRAMLLLEGVANRATDLVVANSEAVRADAIRQERLDPERVLVIPNGVDVERFAAQAAPVRAELGVPADAPLVGVVANLIHYKGHLAFLDAWRRIRERRPDAHALLVGEGPMRAAIERRADELGVAGSVHLLGRRSDVPGLLAAMDVVAHPSEEEGSPNAVLEAMAAGRAVVATAVGGTPEAVLDGRTGLLVPPGDPEAMARAVTALLDDPARAGEMGAAARERVRSEFAVDVMVERYRSLYETALARSRDRVAR